MCETHHDLIGLPCDISTQLIGSQINSEREKLLYTNSLPPSKVKIFSLRKDRSVYHE